MPAGEPEEGINFANLATLWDCSLIPSCACLSAHLWFTRGPIDLKCLVSLQHPKLAKRHHALGESYLSLKDFIDLGEYRLDRERLPNGQWANPLAYDFDALRGRYPPDTLPQLDALLRRTIDTIRAFRSALVARIRRVTNRYQVTRSILDEPDPFYPTGRSLVLRSELDCCTLRRAALALGDAQCLTDGFAEIEALLREARNSIDVELPFNKRSKYYRVFLALIEKTNDLRTDLTTRLIELIQMFNDSDVKQLNPNWHRPGEPLFL